MAKGAKQKKNDAEKYQRQKRLAAARQRKRKANMSEEELEKKRKRDRERYHRLKAEKKIKLASEMNERELNIQRKKWRKKKADQKKRKEEERRLAEDTPENSESDSSHLVATTESRQKRAGRKAVKRDRSKMYRDLKKQIKENELLRKKLRKYKKRWIREKNKEKKVIDKVSSPTPTKKLKSILGTQKVSPVVRKQLFVGLTLEHQLKDQSRSVKNKSTDKKILNKVIGSKIIKKYRVQRQLSHIISYKSSRNMDNSSFSTPKKKVYKTVRVKEAKAITNFFEMDTVSKMLPGKKDFVRRGKVKKQRRLLLDSLKNLYLRFIEESKLKISFATFCRSRPFWVTKPKEKDRETCGCVRHENFQFLATALKKANVLAHDKTHDLIKEVVCSSNIESCMMKKCTKCKSKSIDFLPAEDIEVQYFEWVTTSMKKNIKGVEKVVKRVVKMEKVATVSDLINKFKKELVLFQSHVFAMKHQAKCLQSLKESLKEGELLFQVDFSQNYIAKCTSEIQSMHFGASKRQISLHTGAIYFLQDEEVQCKTFCTASDNLDHQAHGVWAHMTPILQRVSEEFPNTKVVQIFSDSPSSQYRNRYNLHLMKDLLPRHFKNLDSFTWNFSEPGHGKGVMDGVGGSVKRNADQKVLQGHDIMCAKDLVSLFSNSKTTILEISSSSVEDMKKSIPEDINPIKGIMSIRQVYWNKQVQYMFGRKLSCFKCLSPDDSKCKHFHLTCIGCEKKKLKVEDVFSSDDEDQEEEGNVIKPAAYSFDDLKTGTYVVVSFPLGKNKFKNYVAVTLGEVQPDRELDVMFMESYGDLSTFRANENDTSYIPCEQILGILPEPKVISRGNRILHKFKFPVSL